MASWRRVGKLFGGMLAAGVGLVALWGVAQLALAGPSPEPLYKVGDLPAPPPAESNGWQTFRVAGARAVPTPAMLALVPPGGDASADWPHVEREARPLREFLATGPVVATLTAYEAALDRPFFFDACPVRLAESCPALALYQAHRLEELALLGHSLDARPDEAARGTARLLWADAKLLDSARSLVSFRVAVAGARRSLALATLLVARLTDEGRAAVAAAVEVVRLTKPDVLRPLAVEYLIGLEAIDLVASDATAVSMVRPTTPTPLRGRLAGALLVDRGQTRQLLAEHTREWQRWFSLPATTPPPVDTTYGGQPLGWLHNPVGKMALDGLRLPSSTWVQTRRDLDLLQSEAEAVSASLR